MIPNPAFNIWEHTRETLFDLYAKRARNELPEMTCNKQAVELLAPHVRPGWTVLDAGCGSGGLFWSFYSRKLPVEYHGLDYTAGFIALGRENIPADLSPPDRLHLGAIEDLDREYDAVICINTLFCLPNFHQGLERLARAARKILIIRTLLAEKTEIRYETDDYLDAGFRGPGGLRSYFNIFSLSEVMDFLRDEGFEVALPVDERTGDQPELSAGKIFPYRVLSCRRIQEPTRS
ncbi:MAG: methyltransferase [Pseudomonadota bacterium]